MAFAVVRALHAALSYSSETAAWPLQKPRTLRCGFQCPFQLSGLETAGYPPPMLRALYCSFQWLLQLSGLCAQLSLKVPRLPPGPFKSLERSAAAYSGLFSCQGFARSSFLRFRHCSLAPSNPSAAASSCFEPSTAASNGFSSCQGFARSSFVQFRNCRLAPSKASNARNPSTQTVFLLHDVLKSPKHNEEERGRRRPLKKGVGGIRALAQSINDIIIYNLLQLCRCSRNLSLPLF